MNSVSPVLEKNLLRAADYLDLQMETTDKRGMAEKLAVLKVDDSALYYIVLGLMYNIASYQVGDVYGSEAPEHEHALFFASTLAGEFDGAALSIPLAATVEESFKLACEELQLEDLFRRECEAGHDLPRLYVAPVKH